ncbi:MAG: hypothetical protein AAF393_08230 [Pseudomonadota bacterium]
MAATVIIPALMLPDVSNVAAELAILSGALAAAFVIVEYGFKTPSLIEFRFAAPYNRFRFAMLAILLASLTVVFRQTIIDAGNVIVVSDTASALFQFWDFRASPVIFFVALAEPMGSEGQVLIGTAAAVALTVTVAALIVFCFVMLAFSWPLTRDTFNLWINMPTFDAKAGEAAQAGLRNSAFMSLLIGLALPYLAPQAALAFMGPLQPVTTGNSLFLVWMIAIWCFVPAVSILRAAALYKVAYLLSQEDVPQG